MSIEERIAQRMKQKGDRSVMDAVRRTGIPYATMYDLAKGRQKNPSRGTLQKLADGYGVTIDWLLGSEDEAGGPAIQPVDAQELAELRALLEQATGMVARMEAATRPDADAERMAPGEATAKLRQRGELGPSSGEEGQKAG